MPRPPPVFTGADGTVNVGDGKDLFTLNVDLGAAVGLVGLASEATDAGDDFPAHHYFMFTLLGAERSMEALPVLRDRMNVSQGAVVRIRGTWNDVCTALAAARTLRVFFLSSDECLVATATIPLDHFFNAKPDPPEEPLHDRFPLTPHDAGARPQPTLEVTVGLHPASQKLNDMISRLLDQREAMPKDRCVVFFPCLDDASMIAPTAQTLCSQESIQFLQCATQTKCGPTFPRLRRHLRCQPPSLTHRLVGDHHQLTHGVF